MGIHSFALNFLADIFHSGAACVFAVVAGRLPVDTFPPQD